MTSNMKLLAFDTSTEAMSIAVAVGERVWQHTGAGGAQSSATLIPAIQALMQQAGLAYGELDAIAFGQGPGSFTGLRTACSVAQGLGFGGGVQLLPVPTLLAVAEEARFRHGAQQVVALLDARMDELYVACFDFDQPAEAQIGDCSLIRAEDIAVPPGFSLAGNAFAGYGARLPVGPARIDALPTAAAMLRLAPGLLAAGRAVDAADALPLYIRDKVAKTTQERLQATS